ncbi:two pore domain potassium channel family protein [Bermanella marisrubri]|uniref:Potassium channel protein n=1 Tax=Bermanella marisrubri TaxID=207949 RepID=Q1N2E7_9GAMM|nr:potassium channel family protein [Bermanella marisrubri]EAT12460.1 potassium channel protein [Oceanobacter sp. RED65] [Bermanella marisrubri]QIZ85538.1 two pore domain potassium channel family protein [Bermanella marisrubri]
MRKPIFRFNPISHAIVRADKADVILLKKIKRTIAVLALLLTSHVVAMIILENMTPWQAVWLTFTTLTTVGYGDLSAQTPYGQAATMILVYVSAITIVTLLVRDYVDYRIARSERIRSGLWNWNMENHIVIINAPKYNADRFFERLVLQIREDDEYKDTGILLLNHEYHMGLPSVLKDLHVRHITGSPSQESDLSKANVAKARHILVLSRDEYHGDSDSISFDTAYRLAHQNLGHLCIVECVEDANRPRLRELGIKSILRPIRSYPEILVRAMDAPGSEMVIEDMFTRRDDHPERYPIWLEGERWSDVVSAMIQGNIGTPMAFVNKDGQVFVHPKCDDHVHGQSLIIFVKSDDMPTQEEVQAAFHRYFTPSAV